MNRIESCNFEAGAAPVGEVIHPLQQCLRDSGEKIAAAVAESQFREVLEVNADLRFEVEKLKQDSRNYLHEVEALKARIVWLECEAKCEAQPAHDVASVPDTTSMARALCNYHADLCGVNREDQWFLYSDDFKNDVAVMLAAYRAQQEGK